MTDAEARAIGVFFDQELFHDSLAYRAKEIVPRLLQERQELIDEITHLKNGGRPSAKKA